MQQNTRRFSEDISGCRPSNFGARFRVTEEMDPDTVLRLGEGGEVEDTRLSTQSRPKLVTLRTVGHLETGGASIVGDHVLEQDGDISLVVAGKVGCEDDKVVVKNDGKATFLRTRRVHKNKKGTKKAFLKRSLTKRVEEEDEEANGDEEEVTFDDDSERKVVFKALQGHFLSSTLNREEHEHLITKVIRIELPDGGVVCTKGERGDECYILVSGICAVEGRSGEHIAKLSAGSMFGELAMLYDVPRTATIVCASARVVLCKIRGSAFRRCLARFKERTLSATIGFLNHHEIFSKLNLEEKHLFASALVFQAFEAGAKLIDESISTSAAWMYLVQEGSVEITDQYKNRQVLSAGSTFSGQRMAYGVKAVAAKALTKLRVMAIGHQTMDRLFGNISEVLRVASVRHFLIGWKVFRELTDKQQHLVARLFQQQQFKRGEVIVTAGADPQLTVLLDGEVCVTDPNVSSLDELLVLNPTLTTVSPMASNAAHEDAGPDVDEGPEVELPHAQSLKRKEAQVASSAVSSSMSELSLRAADAPSTARRLQRGEFYGESTFRENSTMEHSLIANTDCVVCRAGYDEVCRALRGCAEKTLPLRLIILRNRVKEKLLQIFPFRALYEERLDQVVECFETTEYKADECIQSRGTCSHRFCLVIEGEALLRRGDTLEPLPRWASFGHAELLLDKECDCEVRAASSGCTVHCIVTQRFMEACGVLFTELRTKMKYQDLHIRKPDIIQMEKLGEGQFGVVKRVGVRGLFGETFALKRMAKSKVIDEEQQGPVKLEREILAECCHPLIVRLVTTFQDEGSVYIMMEELSGGDLFTAIREIGNLTEEHSLFFGSSLVLAIEYLHSRGVIYRDLKPENVMLTGSGHVKMVDMGCCSKKVRSYTFVGTPEYIAPEVVLGQGYGQPVDWWSLGVMVYEMICGPLPFGEGCSDPLAIMKEVMEKQIFLPPRVSPDAADFIHSLLERSPEQRLGGSTTKGGLEVRQHQYFDMLNWDAILGMTIRPPYIPFALEEKRRGSMPVITAPIAFESCVEAPVAFEDYDEDLLEPHHASSWLPAGMAATKSAKTLPVHSAEPSWESEDVAPLDPAADVSCFIGF